MDTHAHHPCHCTNSKYIMNLLTTLQLPCLSNQNFLCLIRSNPIDPQGLVQITDQQRCTGGNAQLRVVILSYDTLVVYSAKEQINTAGRLCCCLDRLSVQHWNSYSHSYNSVPLYSIVLVCCASPTITILAKKPVKSKTKAETSSLLWIKYS